MLGTLHWLVELDKFYRLLIKAELDRQHHLNFLKDRFTLVDARTPTLASPYERKITLAFNLIFYLTMVDYYYAVHGKNVLDSWIWILRILLCSLNF